MENDVLRIAGRDQQRVLAALVGANVAIASLNTMSRTLEDVYVQTTRAAEEVSSEVSTSSNGRGSDL